MALFADGLVMDYLTACQPVVPIEGADRMRNDVHAVSDKFCF
jgi:hypothetical protein